MFPSSITLTGDAASSQTYDQISLVGGKCIRDDAARDLGTPRTMIISHENKGSGLTAVDRHLVRLNLVEEDTGTDAIATISSSVYLVIEAPRRIVTKAMIKDQITQLIGFLETATYVDKLLNSEP
jgi:hypothetical protein